jgi:hypothetical protein
MDIKILDNNKMKKIKAPLQWCITLLTSIILLLTLDSFPTIKTLKRIC